MFNVYYINYAKAFEIAMQMDNKILEQTIKDHGWSADGNGQMDIDTGIKNPLISKLLPKLDASLSLNVSKSSRASDTIKIVSTKSSVFSTRIILRLRKQTGCFYLLKDLQLPLSYRQ